MDKMQRAMGIIAAAEKDKYTNVNSKRRAGTKKASYMVSVDGMNNALVNSIHNSRLPEREPVQTIGVYGPKQGLRVWRRP